MMESKPSWSVSYNSMHESMSSSADASEDIRSMATRRLLIDTFEWNVKEEISRFLDPWSTYFLNKRVINRLANFKLLQSKLKITVQLNGNHYYYGRLMVTYTPLGTVDQVSTARVGVDQDNIQLSQRMHIYCDPTSSTGGELELPFIWPKNYVELTRGELPRLGRLNFKTMSPLQHSLGSQSGITVSVWAEAVDMTVNQLTSVNPTGITAQSGSADMSEMPEGPVSKPATAVAKAAGILSKIPIIGPYMRATQVAAGATANIAKAFGYSKPRDLRQATPYFNDFNIGCSTTDVELPCPTLALTAKQEVTIDPATMAAPRIDEMEFVGLAKRESYVTKFEWREIDPVQKRLFQIRVLPTLFDKYQNEVREEYHMTPACWIASAFQFWRGTLIFRFQVVKSCFHKGRLRFVYDPNNQDTDEYNVNQQIIMDVDLNDELVMKIGWGQSTNWLLTQPLTNQEVPFGPFVGASAFDNGVISVYVVNELTTPSVDESPVEVLVFSNATDDFAVNVPTDIVTSRATVERRHTNAGPSWRNIVFPGTLLTFDANDVTSNNFASQSPRNSPSTLVTDAAVNGNPDFDGTFDFRMLVWNEAPVAAAIPIRFLLGYENDTDVTTTIELSMNGTTVSVPLLANTTESAIEVTLSPTVPPEGGSGVNQVLTLTVPNFVVDDVMKVWIDSYTMSVPPGIDYTIIEPGNGLAFGVDTNISAEAKYDDGTPLEGWDMSQAGSALVINPSPGTEFLVNSRAVFLKPEGEPGLSSNIGAITASALGNGLDKIKLATQTVSSSTFIEVLGENGGGLLGPLIAITEDIVPQSGEADDCELPGRPESEAPDFSAGSPDMLMDAASLVHFGEAPVSWRSCLKRFVTAQRIGTLNNNEESRTFYTRPVTPLCKSTLFPTYSTLLDWVVPAYVGWRGSIRYRLDDSSVLNNENPRDNVTFWRHDVYSGSESVNYGIVEVQRPYTWNGNMLTRFTQPKVLEVPWYSPYNFDYAREDPTPAANNWSLDRYHRQVEVFLGRSQATTRPTLSVATGEDFTLSNFVSTPTISLLP